MSRITLSKIKAGTKKSQEGYGWVVYYPTPTDKRKKSKYFKRKTDAQTYEKILEKELRDHGESNEPITYEEREAVYLWRKEGKGNLRDVVTEHLKRNAMRINSMTCEKVMDDLLLKLNAEGKSKNWIYSLENRLKSWMDDYKDWLICEITRELVEEHLTELINLKEKSKLQPQTINNRRRAINQLFNYAIVLGVTDHNPVKHAINIKVEPSDTAILTPTDAQLLLNTISSRSLPAVALALFAGLRRSETEQINWCDIDFDSRTIEISASISKTTQLRTIHMSDNLLAWLKPYRSNKGIVVETPYKFRMDLEKAIKDAGITYGRNCLRHSYGSYHVATGSNIFETATQMGHNDVGVTKKYYINNKIKKEQAELFWSILPEPIV